MEPTRALVREAVAALGTPPTPPPALPHVLTEVRNRGVEDACIVGDTPAAIVDNDWGFGHEVIREARGILGAPVS